MDGKNVGFKEVGNSDEGPIVDGFILVGNNVGLLVGLIVVLTEGDMEGGWDGCAVSGTLGTAVGESVLTREGLTLLGLTEGAKEGKLLGFSDGLKLGLNEGGLLGTSDGDKDGFPVGARDGPPKLIVD